ncbi:GNAT family N-acetyltransferase [Streptococcus hyovaginalis]|uniref:GNAT family N-acetyltransferase n=1 Tax=Streptococcus hyovaginalis TaxID=149015 RepID=UPI002A91C9B6|nr:GNAT family N-acetyltransferase [Streptococcus hyovaginalis]MDY5974161.1 GNAT family N-acetyltransferase [Streptococcus hyovaginalis]
MHTIERVNIDDVETLRELGSETYYDTFKDSVPNPQDMVDYLAEAYSVETLSKEINHPESEYYFLYADGRLVGYVKLNTGDAQTEYVRENTLEIQRIYVRPSEKRQGFGTVLMDFSLERAKEKGCDSVWLGVWENNHAAQAFYKEHGFQKVGEHIFQTGQQEDTDYILLKEL